jgi:hypothetical protein
MNMVRNTLAALAILTMSVPAPAGPIDNGLPPPQYDIGGATEADVIVNYIDRLGDHTAPLVRVPVGGALAECNRIQMQRYKVPYTYDGILLGCLIRDNGTLANPIIVYSYDPAEPGMAVNGLRHEVAHLLGWPGDHPR